MKYVAFFLALLGAVPLAVIAALNRRMLSLVAFCLLVPLLLFNATSINFFSLEFYRGTSRGMEVSLVYVLALAMVMAAAVKGRLRNPFPDLGSLIYLVYFILSALSIRQATVHELNGVFLDGMFVDGILVDGAALGLMELWKMVMMGLVFYAVYLYLDYVRNPTALLRGIAVVVVFCFLEVVKQHYVGISQARGTFPHQNSMAMFMMMVAPVFFVYYLDFAKSAPSFYLYAFAFICGSASLFRSYSRGAMACYPIASAIAAFLCVKRNFKSSFAVRMLPLVLIGMLGMLLLLPKIIDRFEHASSQSGDTRKRFAGMALRMMEAHPYTGVGLNNWGVNVRTDEYLSDDDIEARWHETGIVETVYLLVGAECGIPALIVLLCWYAYYWITAFRLSARLAGTRWFFLPTGIFAGLTGCYLQSTLEWVMKQQVNFVVTMVFFATLAWLNRNWRTLKAEEGMKKLS